MDETFESERVEILKGFCESYTLMKVLGGDAATIPPLDHLVSYVDSLLAEKNAEIKRLEARQITPEMMQVFRNWKSYRSLPRFDPDMERFIAQDLFNLFDDLTESE